jgi:signal transduction histidine kinase
VQKALQNVNKLESLIRDLLDVSKIQSGQLQLNFQLFNIDELLDETISSFQLVSSTHQIIRKDRLNNEMIFADRQRIEQVLVNLLSNAIKYSPGESEVFVNAKKENNQLIIKVRDFGIGIPPEEQSNIFERFYRMKDLAIHISGFGLGLYICRDIITRHHGKIWVETEEKGSAFYFSLPLEIPVTNEKALSNTTKLK